MQQTQPVLKRSASCKEKKSYPHLKAMHTTRGAITKCEHHNGQLENTLNRQLTLKLGPNQHLNTASNHHLHPTRVLRFSKHNPILRINPPQTPKRPIVQHCQEGPIETPPKAINPVPEEAMVPRKQTPSVVPDRPDSILEDLSPVPLNQ